MIRCKKMKLVVWSLALALALVVSLVAGACAPATPTEVAEEIAKLEEEVTAQKARVAGLEAEIAELRAPAEVLRWEPATFAGVGYSWDTLCRIADYINTMSHGRIEVTPTAPGAVCPVEEQLDAVALGSTEAMFIWPGYYSGKIPITAVQGDCIGAPKTASEMQYLYEGYEGGRINELFREEYAKYGVYMVGNVYAPEPGTMLLSKVPVYGIDDIKGLKFRSSEMIAEAFTLLGAGTVWLPAAEMFTALASGLVDGVTFPGPGIAVDMSLHEVTKYWVSKPPLVGPTCPTFIVNMDVWEALPDDLKAIVELAVRAANLEEIWKFNVAQAEAWKFVEDYGIERVEWPDEDCLQWNETLRSLLDKYREDPACAEMFDILERFMLETGYWK